MLLSRQISILCNQLIADIILLMLLSRIHLLDSIYHPALPLTVHLSLNLSTAFDTFEPLYLSILSPSVSASRVLLTTLFVTSTKADRQSYLNNRNNHLTFRQPHASSCTGDNVWLPTWAVLMDDKTVAINWLPALRHISTERLLVPRNVAK